MTYWTQTMPNGERRTLIAMLDAALEQLVAGEQHLDDAPPLTHDCPAHGRVVASARSTNRALQALIQCRRADYEEMRDRDAVIRAAVAHAVSKIAVRIGIGLIVLAALVASAFFAAI